MIYKEFSFGGKQSPLGSFGAIIGIILFLFLLSFILSGLFTILKWATPVLLILAAFFDYTVFIDFGKFILKLLKDNLLFGILAIVLTVVGFPVVSGYLFFKAYARKNLKAFQKEQEPKFSKYEEVVETESEDNFNPDAFKFKQIEKQPKSNESSKARGEYDDLFK